MDQNSEGGASLQKNSRGTEEWGLEKKKKLLLHRGRVGGENKWTEKKKLKRPSFRKVSKNLIA